MGLLAVTGDVLQCTCGASPVPLTSPPLGSPVTFGGKPAATVAHHAPTLHVATFGACSITESPCVPALTAPWAPGASTVLINGQPALTAADKVMCTVGGEISITTPQQQTVSTGG